MNPLNKCWVLPDLHLTLRPDDKDLPWVLDEAIAYRDGTGRLHTVPARYLTDLASIPGFLPLVIDRHRAKRSAVLHDWHYSEAPPGITRKIADDLFFESMLSGGVKRIFAAAYWCAVRFGGWHSWNKYRKSSKRQWKDETPNVDTPTPADVRPVPR